MKKIIVFGATGNTGVYFVDHLKNRLDPNEYEVVAVGRKKTELFKKLGIEYITVDITDPDDFEKLPQDNVYAVVNLAGVLPAYLKSNDPFVYINTNVTGGVRILEYARKTHADRFLYAQTWAEMAGYWGKEEVLSPKMPRSLIYTGDHAFYTITKSMIVETMEHYHEEYGLKTYVFRLPNIYLYNPQKTYFVDGIEKPIAYRYLIDKVSRGEDIEMWGDENAFKDIVYVKDFCNMMYGALFTDVTKGVYNVGTGIKTSFREQLEGIIKVFAPKGVYPKIIEKPEKPSFTSFVMDIENAKAELGYSPQYDYISYLEDYKSEMQLKRFDELFIK